MIVTPCAFVDITGLKMRCVFAVSTATCWLQVPWKRQPQEEIPETISESDPRFPSRLAYPQRLHVRAARFLQWATRCIRSGLFAKTGWICLTSAKEPRISNSASCESSTSTSWIYHRRSEEPPRTRFSNYRWHKENWPARPARPTWPKLARIFTTWAVRSLSAFHKLFGVASINLAVISTPATT